MLIGEVIASYADVANFEVPVVFVALHLFCTPFYGVYDLSASKLYAASRGDNFEDGLAALWEWRFEEFRCDERSVRGVTFGHDGGRRPERFLGCI